MSSFDTIRDDPRIQRLCQSLAAARGPVQADGLWGSSAPILAGIAAERLNAPLLLITAHADDADAARDEIETAVGRAPDFFPALETLPGEADPDDEITGERLRICLHLIALRAGGRERRDPPWLVAPIQALLQPVPAPEAVEQSCLILQVGQRRDPEEIAAWLTDQDFQRCDQVEVPGDWARRGGIIDVFSPGLERPVRIELFGDEIDALRLFDAGTQRSADDVAEVRIPGRRLGVLAGKATDASQQTTSLLALMPPDAIIALHEPTETAEIGRAYVTRLGERAGLIRPEGVFRTAGQFRQLWLQRFSSGESNAVDFNVSSLAHLDARGREPLEVLAELAAEGPVVVVCENEGERERFGEILREQRRSAEPERRSDGATERRRAEEDERPRDGETKRRSGTDQPAEAGMPVDRASVDPALLAERVTIAVGHLHRGFRWNASTPSCPDPRSPIPVPSSTAYVPHHELFRRQRVRRTLRRVQPARPIDSFLDLDVGDFVVHATHGIGRFRGLELIERDGRRTEYLALEYADDAVVHVPVSQIGVVQKYIGSHRGKPKLSKLGGTAWKRTKARVAEAVGDMAAELLAIQARRGMEEGVAYPHDTHWQKEFEAAFPYTETEDQLRALTEIKGDMTRPRPMDRLVCGDVGFGKTELAIRAAFKACEYGKQVAVLAPTTVLCEQHHNTFGQRLADFPFKVDSISRFRTPQEQKKIVERARKGQVDILIGTHRLLSQDVQFSDLGLVIIDEEQRFGVEAKERLKRLRATVDVLTLSATPIPRTLHMAMLGIRDISSLATPPADRRAIVTQVRPWNEQLIRDAITRELAREGQVYFVHNFVRDIHEIANEIRRLAPEARVVVGHGQMEGAELEEVMLTFMRHEADILVSTNIIESGIDIPRANTIFINRADRFGLADLHQLRGRVGRSDHRAYCYLLLSPKVPLTETAARRLKAIEHYSQLGAGFQIAMRDLEIRGAGNILGPEQSGHIEAVGYEMYCQLLEQAVRRMRNEPAETWRDVNLELGVSGAIPRAYVSSQRQRMDVYKRVASLRTMADVASLREELGDVFGPPPPEVLLLLSLAELRVLAQGWGVRSLVLVPPDVVFAIDDLEKAQRLFAEGPGSPRLPDPKTVHWRLPKRLLEPAALVGVLREQMQGRRAEAAGVK